MSSITRRFAMALGAMALTGQSAALRAQAPASVFIEDYTWPELRDAIAAGNTSVLVFSGSVEESGPHLILGKHNIRARVYAERVARELGHTLVAPIVPAAPTGRGLMHFPGTIDIRPEVFAAFNADIVRSLAAAGFKHIFLLGDHAGNQGPLRELAPRLDKELAARGVHVHFIGAGFAKGAQDIGALMQSRHLRGNGHAGFSDTAELWAIDSSGVRPGLIAQGDTSGGDALDAHGVSGDPRGATPELGREFAAIRVRDAVAEIRAMLGAAIAPQRP
jgi:creatinine amidohydrolase/Fe(II)-dependent formamide hydrolase-like protein